LLCTFLANAKWWPSWSVAADTGKVVIPMMRNRGLVNYFVAAC
jgi:hypothetical protein